jgi:hypothetical protein
VTRTLGAGPTGCANGSTRAAASHRGSDRTMTRATGLRC